MTRGIPATARRSSQGKERRLGKMVMSRAFPFVTIREEEWCARREISGPMGVLAFGDSSTWAIKDYEDPTHVKKLAKASHKPFEEREKEKKAGLVSLKKVLQAPSSKDKSRKKSRGVRELNPLSPPSSDSNNPNFAPRSAWPEGKFTIKYPKGYDPELKRFVKDHTGSAVVVTKLPAAVRRRLEDEAKAREEAEAKARKEAAAVLNLDEEYLEKVRVQTETAKGRRRKFGQAASTSVKSTSTPPAPVPVEKAAPDPALLASVGVDDGYMAKLAEQEAARRAVKEARAAKAKAAAQSAVRLRQAARTAVRESDPEMATYAREYADRAREQAEQRAMVAASRKAVAEAAAVTVNNKGGGGKRRRKRQ